MSTPRSILLVDDSENDRLLMRAAFKKAGFDIPVQEARNGEEAIAYLQGAAPYSDRGRFPLPTVMLMDLNMPMKNGFDILAWVRNEPGLKRLSVIVLTASMRAEDVERAFDLGANAFLVKPGNLDALTAMICSLRDWLQINHFPPLGVR
jgi:Response regulators consisting of a CheY-like receiver domain and a winged-helix DNA-binding domain